MKTINWKQLKLKAPVRCFWLVNKLANNDSGAFLWPRKENKIINKDKNLSVVIF